MNIETQENLVRYENVIQEGLQSFVEVGKALLAIRDEKLYKENYNNFNDYCRDRWNLGKSRVYQLINASNVMANLALEQDATYRENQTNSTDSEETAQRYDVFPQTESQVRPLVRLQPDEQREAWNKAIEISESVVPTAKEVLLAVDELYPQANSEPPEREEKPKESIILENHISGRFQCPDCSHAVVVQAVSLQLTIQCQVHEKELALQEIIGE